jgi:hypothetical protein
MRVDTTVVETNIHYPTDSSLLGDGVRVLTRVMKKITGIVGEVGAKLRDRSRSVKYRVMEIARAARAKSPQSRAKLDKAYGNLLTSTSRVVGQAKRFAREIIDGTKRARGFAKQAKLEVLRCELETMLPRVRQVIKGRSAHLSRRDAQRKQDRQLVRAFNRDHSQGEGRQAQRIWQDGETTRGGKPDRHPLRGQRRAPQRREPRPHGRYGGSHHRA